MVDDSGTVRATAYVYGTGVGPQVTFQQSAQLPVALVNRFANLTSVAVDVQGNVYVADYGSNAVNEILAGCSSASCVFTLGGGFNGPFAVAVDGGGNVYVAEYVNSTVKKIPAGCGSASCVTTLGGGFNRPRGLAVDGSGNVYVADYENSAVKEMPTGCGSSSCVTTLGGDFTYPAGVAVDGSGNVYVSDTGSYNTVKEMPAGCSSASCVTTLGGGFDHPLGIAVDASGTVYVANGGTNGVKEIPVGCGSSSCVTTIGSRFSDPYGVALDGNGNVYVADYLSGVQEMPFASPPSLAFSTMTNVGGTDGPQTVTVGNIGNAGLVFPSPTTGMNASIAAGFTLSNSSTCPALSAISSPFTLAAGSSCTYLVSFAPTAAGANSGSLVLTDNNLNITSSTQAIALSGAARVMPTITTAPTASAITYGQTLASSTLSGGVASVAGTFAWTSSSTMPPAGTSSYSVTFTPTDTTNYSTATTTVSVTINKAIPSIIDGPTASGITYGQTLASSTLTGGGASVAGSFAWAASTTIPPAGTSSYAVVLTPTDVTDYSTATVQRSILVNKASTTLTGPAGQPIQFLPQQGGTVTFALAGQYSGTGIASPTGSFAYSLLNSANTTVASGVESIFEGLGVAVPSTLAPGLYTVAVSYAGDSNYAAATAISISLLVGQLQPTAAITAPGATLTYGSALGITASATLNSANVAGRFSYTAMPSGGSATAVTAATVLQPGTYTLTATFTPTDTVTYKTATASAALTVSKATVGGVSLTSSVNSVLVQSPLTLTAAVTSIVNTPSGTVTFYDNTASTPIASNVALAGGMASVSVSTLSVGTHSITAIYSGDGNFLTATSAALNQSVQDFTLTFSASPTSSTASQTISPGGTANFAFTLAPSGATFPAAVTLSVSGLPTNASYTLTPTSLAAGAGATPVTLTITPPAIISKLDTGERLAPIALALLLLPFSGKMRRKAGVLGRYLGMLLLLIGGVASLSALAGCGSTAPQSPHTYTVTITGTSGTLSHSTTVSLTVQ